MPIRIAVPTIPLIAATTIFIVVNLSEVGGEDCVGSTVFSKVPTQA